MRVKSAAGILAGLIVPVVSLWVLFNQQKVIDWWQLREYQPSDEVAALATDAGMNDTGRRLFYLQDPQLLSKADFSGKCSMDEQTIVLGCYVRNESIYIFNVDEERLSGIEEVTAAHEMLHAVYDRLGEDERDRLDSLLTNTFNNLQDERIAKTIQSYRDRDESIVANELHSILGTEVGSLPLELEDHYARYFTNRSQVVAKANAYAAEFAALEARIADFDKQLEVLSVKIESQKADIEQLNQALSEEKVQLDGLLESDTQAYAAAVPAYNDKVRDYNGRLETLRADINEYNRLVGERNAIALEEQNLVKAIDSRVVPEE